jgi:hypothetical protein
MDDTELGEVAKAAAMERFSLLLRYYFGGHSDDTYAHAARVFTHDRILQLAMRRICSTPAIADKGKV